MHQEVSQTSLCSVLLRRLERDYGSTSTVEAEMWWLRWRAQAESRVEGGGGGRGGGGGGEEVGGGHGEEPKRGEWGRESLRGEPIRWRSYVATRDEERRIFLKNVGTSKVETRPSNGLLPFSRVPLSHRNTTLSSVFIYLGL